MSKRRKKRWVDIEDDYGPGEGIIISGVDEFGFGKDPLPNIPKPVDTKELGISALSALAVLGIGSVIAPGAMTGDPAHLNAGNLWGSLGLGLVVSGGIYYGFEKTVPAIAAAGASVLVFLVGMVRMNAVKSAPPAPGTSGLGFDPEVGV